MMKKPTMTLAPPATLRLGGRIYWGRGSSQHLALHTARRFVEVHVCGCYFGICL